MGEQDIAVARELAVLNERSQILFRRVESFEKLLSDHAADEEVQLKSLNEQSIKYRSILQFITFVVPIIVSLIVWHKQLSDLFH